jgi:hypothetical protein
MPSEVPIATCVAQGLLSLFSMECLPKSLRAVCDELEGLVAPKFSTNAGVSFLLAFSSSSSSRALTWIALFFHARLP